METLCANFSHSGLSWRRSSVPVRQRRAQLSGGLTFPGPGTAHSTGGGCADADFIAWKAAVGAVGATQETATCNLIISLKAHSLWTTTDRIWLFASENTTQALTDIKSLSVATVPAGSPAHVASQGYTGNGTTYVNTGYTSGTNFTQNSASATAYVRNNRTSGANYVSLGNYDSPNTGNTTILLVNGNTNVTSWEVNNAAAFGNHMA